MNKRYHNLVGRDDPMFEESGSSVALRFEVNSRFIHHAFVGLADMFGSGLGTSPGVVRFVVHLSS
jgi:hypothetical protein